MKCRPISVLYSPGVHFYIGKEKSPAFIFIQSSVFKMVLYLFRNNWDTQAEGKGWVDGLDNHFGCYVLVDT